MDLHQDSKQETDYEPMTSFLPNSKLSQQQFNHSGGSPKAAHTIVRKLTNETIELADDNKSVPVTKSTRPQVRIQMSERKQLLSLLVEKQDSAVNSKRGSGSIDDNPLQIYKIHPSELAAAAHEAS